LVHLWKFFIFLSKESLGFQFDEEMSGSASSQKHLMVQSLLSEIYSR